MTPTYTFDHAAADRVCEFFERFLRHWKGPKAGQPFRLLPWQRTVLRDLFGWKRADGTRRYRTAYIEVPRKNGKSLYVAGVLLYLLCADGEQGAEVYAVANTAEQSGVAFRDCRSMVSASPELSSRLVLKQYTIDHPASRSVLKALSGESVGTHGKNIHGLSVDELHEGRSQGFRDLYEALTTSMGARRQPLTVQITTAGRGDDETICAEQHAKALKYLSGEVRPGDADHDDTFYAVVFGAGRDDDWTDPATWRKANPSLGEAVTAEYLAAECVKAKASPSLEGTFRRLYLNQWTETTTRWLKLDEVDACRRPINAAEVADLPCYVGTDLSSVYDLTAVVALYVRPDDTWLVVPRFYVPEPTAHRRYRDDGTPFPEWIERGHVVATRGDTIDYDKVEEDVIALANGGNVRLVAFDPYNATQLMGRIERAGVNTVGVNQNFLAMSAACKEVERRLGAGAIVLDENPCLRWMAANVEVEADRHGNIRPVKPKRRKSYKGTAKFSIDGIVALVVAASRAMLTDPREETANAGVTCAWA